MNRLKSAYVTPTVSPSPKQRGNNVATSPLPSQVPRGGEKSHWLLRMVFLGGVLVKFTLVHIDSHINSSSLDSDTCHGAIEVNQPMLFLSTLATPRRQG